MPRNEPDPRLYPKTLPYVCCIKKKGGIKYSKVPVVHGSVDDACKRGHKKVIQQWEKTLIMKNESLRLRWH